MFKDVCTFSYHFKVESFTSYQILYLTLRASRGAKLTQKSGSFSLKG